MAERKTQCNRLLRKHGIHTLLYCSCSPRLGCKSVRRYFGEYEYCWAL